MMHTADIRLSPDEASHQAIRAVLVPGSLA